jgi:16S rRNA (guanine527-N7)-methyltransferase
MKQKEICQRFIKELLPDEADELMQALTHYHTLLEETNSIINLYSRKTDPADLWTFHFLDSLLYLRTGLQFKGRVLDFGTGGGLPGIPIKLVCKDIRLDLMDSTKKKIAAVNEMAKELGLSQTRGIWSRVEDLAIRNESMYDFIVCRSVRILPEYKPLLLKLLKREGKIVLYKSKNLDDVEQFDKKQIIDVSHPEIGTRKLIIIEK